MAERRLDVSLQAALADLVKWLDATPIPAIIIGGVAASVLGRPQTHSRHRRIGHAARRRLVLGCGRSERYGIAPRIPDALGFARRSRVLLMRHTRSAIDLDITFSGLPFEQSAIEKGTAHVVGGVLVRLPRVEDLLVMKAVAHRPKDLEDIRGLLDAHSEVDVTEVRAWVKEFARATGMADMLAELDKLLEQRRK